jgi:hypothetical protein
LIQEELELIMMVFKDIKKIASKLEGKLETTNNIIKFPNSRSKEEFRYINIEDTTNIIMDDK